MRSHPGSAGRIPARQCVGEPRKRTGTSDQVEPIPLNPFLSHRAPRSDKLHQLEQCLLNKGSHHLASCSFDLTSIQLVTSGNPESRMPVAKRHTHFLLLLNNEAVNTTAPTFTRKARERSMRLAAFHDAGFGRKGVPIHSEVGGPRSPPVASQSDIPSFHRVISRSCSPIGGN
jgi:hypothetical protein